jgi:hypothetical protein
MGFEIYQNQRTVGFDLLLKKIRLKEQLGLVISKTSHNCSFHERTHDVSSDFIDGHSKLWLYCYIRTGSLMIFLRTMVMNPKNHPAISNTHHLTWVI